MRVLVCGSRTYTARTLPFDDPMGAVMRDWLDEDTTIIHGGARGADSLAHEHAVQLGYSIEVYPADWDRYGKRAGYVRNQQMLDEGQPWVVYAFVDKPLAESKGTAMMVDIAAKAGLPVHVVQSL